MCGKLSTTKDGESTYKMLLLLRTNYLEIRDVLYLVFSMVMVVDMMISRSWCGYICCSSLFWIVSKTPWFQEKSIFTMFKGYLLQVRRDDANLGRQKLIEINSSRTVFKRKFLKISKLIKCGKYRSYCSYNLPLYLCCQCRRL